MRSLYMYTLQRSNHYKFTIILFRHGNLFYIDQNTIYIVHSSHTYRSEPLLIKHNNSIETYSNLFYIRIQYSIYVLISHTYRSDPLLIKYYILGTSKHVSALLNTKYHDVPANICIRNQYYSAQHTRHDIYTGCALT